MLDPSVSLALDQNALAVELANAHRSPAVAAETANQWTHGLGLVLSLAAVGVMLPTVLQQSDGVRIAGCVVYLVSLVALYAASTLSHSFDDPARRAFYRMLDQVCIFLMIAGNFTPFGLTHLHSGGWNWILPAMWLLVCLGIAVRVARGDGAVPFAYFALIGWLPVLTLGAVYDLCGATGLSLVVGGGLAYTGGLWFLTNDHRHPYLHAVWHLCTITGSACHFVFVQWYVAEWPLA